MEDNPGALQFPNPYRATYAPIGVEAWSVAWVLEQSRYFTQGCVISSSSPITSLWSRSLATEHSTKLTILGYFASNNDHCLGILKSRISPRRQTPQLMQHIRVIMQSSCTSLKLCPGMDSAESAIIAAIRRDASLFTALSCEHIAVETSSEPGMCLLMVAIGERLPRHTSQNGRHTCGILYNYTARAGVYQTGHPKPGSGGNSSLPSQQGTSNSLILPTRECLRWNHVPFDRILAGHIHRHPGDPR